MAEQIFHDSLSFSDACVLLEQLGVKFRERNGKFECFLIPLTSEEGVSMARTHGELNLSGCCGNLSQFQSNFSSVWYDGDWWNASDLTKLVMSAHDHEGLEPFHLGQEKSMYGDASNEDCRKYMEATVKNKNFANSNPWSRFAAVWRISADHLDMGLSWLDMHKDRPGSLYSCYRNLAAAAMAMDITNRSETEPYRDKDHDAALRRFHVLKGLGSLRRVASFLEGEDLTPMECYGIVDENGVVMDTWDGPAIYTSRTAADAVSKLYSEAPHAKEKPRVVRVNLTESDVEVIE